MNTRLHRPSTGRVVLTMHPFTKMVSGRSRRQYTLKTISIIIKRFYQSYIIIQRIRIIQVGHHIIEIKHSRPSCGFRFDILLFSTFHCLTSQFKFFIFFFSLDTSANEQSIVLPRYYRKAKARSKRKQRTHFTWDDSSKLFYFVYFVQIIPG